MNPDDPYGFLYNTQQRPLIDTNTWGVNSGGVDSTVTPNTSGLSGLNWLGSGGIAGAVTGGLQGLGALANAYVGLQNYNLAKQQFGFQKGLANRNLANQAKMINTQYDSNAIKSAQLSGYSDYANREATALGLAKEKYVDGSKIR